VRPLLALAEGVKENHYTLREIVNHPCLMSPGNYREYLHQLNETLKEAAFTTFTATMERELGKPRVQNTINELFKKLRKAKGICEEQHGNWTTYITSLLDLWDGYGAIKPHKSRFNMSEPAFHQSIQMASLESIEKLHRYLLKHIPNSERN